MPFLLRSMALRYTQSHQNPVPLTLDGCTNRLLSVAIGVSISEMELIDTHCHLDLGAFDADRMEVIKQARGLGVRQFVIPGVEQKTWSGLIQFCNTEDYLHPALGLHPFFLESHTDQHLSDLSALIEKEYPIAVGEIGLDYQVKGLNRDRQEFLFGEQLRIARQQGLPVLLHVRKAHDQVIRLLKQHQVKGGICHAFNGSRQQADQYLDLGFKLGFGGMLTYERSTRLRSLARALPLEGIVLETDSPDMVGAQHQYGRNSPEYLPEILKALSEVREQDSLQVAEMTSQNARDVLQLLP